MNISGFLAILALYVINYLGLLVVIQALFAFSMGLVFLYFFFRMIKPKKKSNTLIKNKNGANRTIEDIFISEIEMQQVSQQIKNWIKQEKIVIEAVHADFIRGRLGVPSGLGLTAPKYFEITLTPQENGVKVHVEGWISVYDVSEHSFTDNPLAYGNIPRRKGWKVLQNLLTMLHKISEK